jgi:riboflavin kinase/FMN adenylyltransferase
MGRVVRVVRHLARAPRVTGRVVLTLGNFDGVHLGHQAILARATERAGAVGGRVAVLTFEPHPVAVLAAERAPVMLQSLHDRLETLRTAGVALAVVQRFTRRFAALEPEAFVTRFLMPHLQLAHVVVGYNVTFGRNRAGSSETLRRLGDAHGFGVDVVGPVTIADDRVSSSRIRRAVQAGEVARAEALLGRPFALRGRVVEGDRRGRLLGFPTANLHVRSGLVLPADGVYAVQAEVDGRRHPAVLNVGVRPTFGGRRRTIEAHLLDFDGDLYRRWMRLHLVDRLRGEMAFAGPDALKAAIAGDVAQARRVLAGGARRG